VFNPTAKLHKIGRFDGIKLIGVGGSGVVFEVRDPVLDRTVALKLCKNLGREGGLALLYEAQILAQLAHPNIVTVHEAGWHGDEIFYVMEFVAGCSAHQYFNVCESWQDAVDVYAAAGSGLAAAHERGIIHGDLKPGNILVGEDGRVRVADFGLARVIAKHTPRIELEQRDYKLGTFGFMAPERLRGAPGDARSDQFSFCVSLWELLYGTLPFAGETRELLLESIERGDRRSAETLPELPRGLRALLEQGLALDPDQRHPNMHTLVRTLLELRARPQRRRSIRPMRPVRHIRAGKAGRVQVVRADPSSPSALLRGSILGGRAMVA
jgi:serine/threonine protein kinase